MPKGQITIFGSYNQNSVGDKIILISLLDLLLRNTKIKLKIKVITFDKDSIQAEVEQHSWRHCVEIISLGNNTKNSDKERKSSVFEKMPKVMQIIISGYIFNKSLNKINLKNSDALIIGGGNLLMDIFASWPIRPFLLQKRFISQNKPTYLIGVGAFPIQNPFNSYLLKSILKNTKFIFVRDSETQKFLEKKWLIRNQYRPDLAFSYPMNNVKYNSKKKYNRIAVNATPIFSKNWVYKDPTKYRIYIENLSSQLYQHYLKNGNVEYMFYDTNHPTDSEASLHTIQNLIKLGYPKNLIDYENKLNSITELAKKIQTCDIAITTRLHAAIFALKMGKPTLCIAYQPKVRSILKNIGLSKAIIEIDKINNIDKSLNLIKKGCGKYKLTLQEIKKIDKINFQTAQKIIIDIYKK